MQPKQWQDLTDRQKRGIVVLGVLQLALLVGGADRHPPTSGRRDQRQQAAVDGGRIHQRYWPDRLLRVWAEAAGTSTRHHLRARAADRLPLPQEHTRSCQQRCEYD